MTGTAWERPLADAFMLRLAGLPVDAVHGLRSADSVRWAEEVLDTEDRLRGLAARLSDGLAVVVGAAGDEPARRRALRLRRAVFNNRVPQDPSAVLELAGEVGGETGALLGAWLADRIRLEQELARGPELLAGELASGSAALRSAAADERLRKGLLLASSALDAQLDGYLDAKGACRRSGPGRSSGRCWPTCTARPARPARSAPSPASRRAPSGRTPTPSPAVSGSRSPRSGAAIRG